MPRITACGSRRDAYDSFTTAARTAAAGHTPLLLVDSEGPVSGHDPWRHLKSRPADNWDQPPNATADQCHLMVQCMEAWFLCDRPALGRFFGQGLLLSALPANANVEAVPKDDVYRGLQNATRNCKVNDAYGKGQHSFNLLALIDPAAVTRVSPWAKRFVDTLHRLAG